MLDCRLNPLRRPSTLLNLPISWIPLEPARALGTSTTEKAVRTQGSDTPNLCTSPNPPKSLGDNTAKGDDPMKDRG